jgi:hypothetical protein
MKRTKYFDKETVFQISSPDQGFIADKPGLMVYDATVEKSQDQAFPVLVENGTNKTYKIKRGCVLGKVESVKSINSVDNTKHSVQDNQTDKPTFTSNEIQTPPEWRSAVVEILEENPSLFANSDLDLTQTQTVTCTVDTGAADPIRQKPYITPFNKRQVIDQAVEDMLKAEVIERSQSPWSFPVVVVDKADGTKRFCVDFRKLNKITKPMSYPLPLIDDILAMLGQAKFYTCLDLKSGYWQVRMDEKDKEKTAFACHKGLFQFRVMPFGLSNAPSIFMMLMNSVLQGLESFSCAYLNDVIIFSKTAEEHKQHIKQVFNRFHEHSLKLKLKKCKFFASETEYLGFQIGSEGIRPKPEKVQAIKDMVPPTNVREVRSFIGMCSYYRRFVPKFSQIAEPFIALTRKFARFRSTENCQYAFDLLKKCLSEAPMLTYPDTARPYVLYTDASDMCVGACLAQVVQEDGVEEEKPIYFLSHHLSDTQQRWPTVENEAYAIQYALVKLDQYLHNAEFVIKTDHKPLQYLLDSPMKNRKIQMWALNLSGYNCTIEYIPGPQNVLADMLSRIPMPKAKQDLENETEQVDINDNTFQVNAINSNKFDPKKFASIPAPEKKTVQKPEYQLSEFDLVKEQEEDPEVNKLRVKIKDDKATEWEKKRHIFFDDVLYFISTPEDNPHVRLFVPKQLRNIVLSQYHDDNGHLGMDKTYDTIGVKYYWPGMFLEIHEYISGCTACQARVLKTKKPPLSMTDFAPYPFAKISMDISGPYPKSLSGNKYILSIVDHYSGWPEAFPLPDKSAENIAHRVAMTEKFSKKFVKLKISIIRTSKNRQKI